MDILKTLLKLPYWVIALVLGVLLVVLPCVSIDNNNHWTTHSPGTLWLVAIGIVMLVVSFSGFGYTLLSKNKATADNIGSGVDLTRVKEMDDMLWTTVNSCEIRVVNGHIEDYAHEPGTAIVLPCNEYFDDRCAGDTRSSLGAYVNRVFEGRAAAFVSLIQDECHKKLGEGKEQQKTNEERAKSFGVGKCVLLLRPLGHSVPVALVSTTTQRASEGLAARISYLFEGMHELVKCLADARLREVAMPVLGAGHGQIDPPLAFVGLLLAVAEVARHGQGGQRLKRVTIVVFKQDKNSQAAVDQVVVRRALALIGSRD